MKRDGGDGRLARSRLIAAVAAMGLAVFVAAVAVEVAPDSIAAQQARRVTRPFMHPFLAQRWSLFAPEVPRTNFTTHLQVRYRDIASVDGAEVTGPLLDVSRTLDSSVKATRWAPNRTRRIVTALEIQAANYAQYRLTLDAAQARHPGKPLPDALTRDIGHRRALLEERYGRFLSSLAIGTVPDGAEVTGVRVVVSTTGIPRLGRGRDASNPMAKTTVAYDSGWMPAAEGVQGL